MADKNANRQKSRNRKVVDFNGNGDGGEYNAQQMNQRLKKHRRLRKRRMRRVVFAIALALIIFFVWFFNRSYHSYSLISSTSREDTDSSAFVPYKGGFIRYSNDGASLFDSSGTMQWNYSYSMSKPEIRVNGAYFAVGDMTGNTIQIFDDTGFLRSITTSKTIMQFELSANGLAAASLSDGSANYVSLYGNDGSELYSVKTTLTGEGYPLSLAISDDAEDLLLAYAVISGDSVTSTVAFYNFSGAGQDKNNRLIGGFDNFDTALVGNVHFFGNSTAAAVSENAITYYSVGASPSQTTRVDIADTINTVFYGDNEIGLIIEDDTAALRMEIYNLSGRKLCSTPIGSTYTNFELDNGRVYMNNDTSFRIYTTGGRKIADITSELPISDVVPNGKRGSCFLITSDYIQQIDLH